MEKQLLAKGWSRGRIAELLQQGSEPQPQPQPQPQHAPLRRTGKGSARRCEPEPEPESEMQIGLDLGPRARRRALVAAGVAPCAPQLTPRQQRTGAVRPSSASARGTKHLSRMLTPASVYVRIRPLAASGGHAEGEAVRKQLECWTDTSVTIATEYMFSKGEAEYTFPTHVFGPQVGQQGVWEGAGGPELVEQVTTFGGHNVIYFAYGQTGAGKTHTMLGTDESIAAPREHFDPDWGIFPRAVASIFETMEGSGRTFLITASAIEFYMCQCLDLLDAESELTVDANTHAVAGAKRLVLSELSDLLPFLVKVQTNRTTRSTAMNRAEGEHGGSSRSHAGQYVAAVYQHATCSGFGGFLLPI